MYLLFHLSQICLCLPLGRTLVIPFRTHWLIQDHPLAVNTLFWKKRKFTVSRDENLDKYFFGPTIQSTTGIKAKFWIAQETVTGSQTSNCPSSLASALQCVIRKMTRILETMWLPWDSSAIIGACSMHACALLYVHMPVCLGRERGAWCMLSAKVSAGNRWCIQRMTGQSPVKGFYGMSARRRYQHRFCLDWQWMNHNFKLPSLLWFGDQNHVWQEQSKLHPWALTWDIWIAQLSGLINRSTRDSKAHWFSKRRIWCQTRAEGQKGGWCSQK